MARYIKPKCKMSRRLGLDIGLKGIGGRDISSKCKLKIFPGQHGNKRKKVLKNYALQLTAKQTIKFMYGLMEKQFRHVYNRVLKKKGARGEILLKMLESRLDNIVYRMGFALTRAEARQLVSHKSILIKNEYNERNISIPSYIVKPGDIIKVSNFAKNQVRIKYALKCAEKNGFVKWIDIDVKNMLGKYIRYPERHELPNNIKEQLVVEFYSK